MGRRAGNKLEKWEIALAKAMLSRGFIPQDVQAYFSRPTRSINHARISEIRDGTKHKSISAASDEKLDEFLSAWPEIDPGTGLHIKGDELLIKAREAMIAAVHTFNGAGLNFRAELFIVTSVIAWTYLLHAFYKKEGIDYRHKKSGKVLSTGSGADKYWELSQCLSFGKCPLDKGVVSNLRFLIEVRNEIEHRSTNRIDDALSSKLQACCINFNDAIKTLFGRQFGLEKRLPISLQFVTFDGVQRASLVSADLPPNLEAAIDTFQSKLSADELTDRKFRYRIAFVPQVVGKPEKADLAVRFIKEGSPEASAIDQVLLKETEKQKFIPSQIVKQAQEGGFPKFRMHDHTLLVNKHKARDPKKGYGVWIANSWYWYENWLEKVLKELETGWTR